LCVTLGYPDPAAERALLLGEDRRAMLKSLPAAMTSAELAEAQRALRAIHTSPALIDYVHALVLASRQNGFFAEGLSPRAALALVQAVFNAVAAHRLLPTGGSLSATVLAQRLLDTVAIP
jgi:MoxR-like ATPase